jgi:hypothetical protein
MLSNDEVCTLWLSASTFIWCWPLI